MAVHYEALTVQEQYVSNLPLEIKTSMREYTGEHYYAINEAFRLQRHLDYAVDRKIVQDLMEAFAHVPPLTSPIQTYRGLEQEYQNVPSFVSSSMDLETAEDFSTAECCILSLTIPPGSKVLPMYVISEVRHEQEILLPPEGSYQVTNVRTVHLRKTYDVTYLPQATVPLESVVLAGQRSGPIIKLPELTFEQWKVRILDLVSPEEVELLGPKEAIDSVIEDYFKDQKFTPLFKQKLYDAWEENEAYENRQI